MRAWGVGESIIFGKRDTCEGKPILLENGACAPQAQKRFQTYELLVFYQRALTAKPPPPTATTTTNINTPDIMLLTLISSV